MRTRTLVAALALLLPLLLPLATAAPAAAATATTGFLFLDSAAGDTGGYGQQLTLTQQTHRFNGFVSDDGTRVDVDLVPVDNPVVTPATLGFYVPDGVHTGSFVAGTSWTTPQLSGGWYPGTCYAVSGDFTINDYAATGTALERLAATFRMHCDGATADFRGEIRFNSDVPVQGRTISPLLARLPDVRSDRVTNVPATLSNPGGGPLGVTSVAVASSAGGQLALHSDACDGTSLPIGQSCAFSLDVKPTGPGSIDGTLELKDSITPAGRLVAVHVQATKPNLQFGMAFSATTVGTTTSPRDGYLANDGDGPIVINAVSVINDGGTNDFQLDRYQCDQAGLRLAPFSTCTVRVVFAPSSPGWHHAVLDVSTDWGTFDFPITGDGAAPLPPPPPPGRHGYWMIGARGDVYAFGDARHYGSPVMADAVDLEPSASGRGYWIVDSLGSVANYGDSPALGGHPALLFGERVTSLSHTPDGAGYWLFTSLGRVFSYGTAQSYGDMSGTRLNGPVLDSIPTPSGHGYYMVASDGGIFTFGDAVFSGSMGNVRLNKPVQSLVPDADGSGYWLVASDGGIFAFDAPFLGSMGGTPLNRPVTGMVGFGAGYLMVGEDGGIFSFGDAPFFGSLGDQPPAQPIVSTAVLNQL